MSDCQLPTCEPEIGAEVYMAVERLLHELWFKRSHFTGLRYALTRQGRERLFPRWSQTHLLDVVSRGEDPITEVLQAIGELLPEAPVDRWQRSESSLNARLRLFFALLGPRERERMLSELFPEQAPWAATRLASGGPELNGKRIDSQTGQPDLVVLGDGAALLGEMKVRGSQSRECYDEVQLIKYARLSQLLRTSNPSLRTVHVIFAPGGRTVIRREVDWISRDPASARLMVDHQWVREAVAKLRPALIRAGVVEELGVMPLYQFSYEDLRNYIRARAEANTLGARAAARQAELLCTYSHPVRRTA